MKIRKHKINKRRRGLETVEAAVILPIVLLLTFGVLKYGWLFLKYQQITNAARHLARVAIRPGDRLDEMQDEFGYLMEDANITGADYSPQDGANVGVGNSVTVEVWVSVGDVDILPMRGLIPTPDELRASVTMQKEGPGPGS